MRLAGNSVVMVLDSTFPPPAGGGTEAQVLTLARELTAEGLHVVVVTPRSDPRKLVAERIEGIDVVRLSYPKIPKIGGAVVLARLALWLLLHGQRHAAVHAHIASGLAGVASVVGRAIGRPVVVKLAGGFELNTGLFAPGRHGVSVWVLRWALRQASFYQATSDRLADHLVARGFAAGKVRRVPNAIDLDRFQPAPVGARDRDALAPDADLVGVFVGRLVVEKALEPFIEAWARAIAPDAPVALLVVGSGPLEERLRELTRRLGRDRQIRFVGAQRDVRPYLRAADFGVLPSTSEGLSNALLEYMALALPVLGSRISGTEDLVVPGETGWLFESGDGAELEARLREIAALPRDRLRALGRNARARVERHSGVAAIAARLRELYGLAPGSSSAAVDRGNT